MPLGVVLEMQGVLDETAQGAPCSAALLRCGRLEAALAGACPGFVVWREHWRTVARDPERHWEAALHAPARRPRGTGRRPP